MRIERGFTLLEVLMSAIIIAVAIIPLSRVIVGVLDSRVASERMTKAAMLAEEKLEEIKHEAAVQFDVNRTGSGTFPPPDTSYRYSVQDDGDPLMKTFSVTVWFDEDGDGMLDEGEINIRLDTRFTRRD